MSPIAYSTARLRGPRPVCRIVTAQLRFVKSNKYGGEKVVM